MKKKRKRLELKPLAVKRITLNDLFAQNLNLHTEVMGLRAEIEALRKQIGMFGIVQTYPPPTTRVQPMIYNTTTPPNPRVPGMPPETWYGKLT